MPTVSHLVQKYVRSLPHLEQFIERDLVSFHRLARALKPEISRELGKDVDDGAIVMALSRLRDRMGERKSAFENAPDWGKLQLSLRSGATEIDIAKSPRAHEKVQRLQGLMEGSADEIFSMVAGQYEYMVIVSAAYEEKFLAALKGEKILHIERNISLVYLRYPPEVLYLPGFYERVLSELAWENINVFEVVSTLTELILCIKEDEAARAYDVLRRALGKKK
jgi:hypothetical protein